MFRGRPASGRPVRCPKASIAPRSMRRWRMRSRTKQKPGLGETRELVIIQGGRLVHEQYAAGLQRRHAARVVVDGEVDHAGAGRSRLQAGQGDVDAPMGNPHWQANDKRAQIPWRTWLQMTDGMRYLEIEAKTVADSDASRKLFGPGRLDVAKYCAGLPLIYEPGTHWNYNSCGIVLTADALTRAIVPNPESPQARRAAMLQWMQQSLFDVIGMKPQPEFDASGLLLRQRSHLRVCARLREIRTAVPARRNVGRAARAAGRVGRLCTHGWQERRTRISTARAGGSVRRKAAGVRIRRASTRDPSAMRSARRDSRASTRWSCRRKT